MLWYIYTDICKYIHTSIIKNNEKVVLHYVKLVPTIISKQILKKVDQHTGGRWLIHSTKHGKDNKLQSSKVFFFWEN